MIFSEDRNSIFTAASGRRWWRVLFAGIFAVALALSSLLLTNVPPALASLQDDRYDGTIFALYGGNGSLVPPKSTIADSLQRKKPVLLVFYTDDSSDCKQYATTVSQLQQFYGRAASFIPLTIDSLPATPSPELTEPSHYYTGFVPQTVILDQSGKVVFDAKGQV
ncbi:MAG: thylakoid membrane photosystem I accumulation factor, partial [Microcoleus sp.]